MLELGVAVAVAGEVLIYKQRCSCNGQWHAACHRTLGRHTYFFCFCQPSFLACQATRAPVALTCLQESCLIMCPPIEKLLLILNSTPSSWGVQFKQREYTLCMIQIVVQCFHVARGMPKWRIWICIHHALLHASAPFSSTILVYVLTSNNLVR
jgi:hypothetical protein